MVKIKNIDDYFELFNYCKSIESPYFFAATYDKWKGSLFNDIDGEGRELFTQNVIKGAYENEKLVGFIQYGISSFGFDERGEISEKVHYQIIRNIYFERSCSDAGDLLLHTAMEAFDIQERIYAFFHYFGMSVYARHGKIFEKYDYIGKMLERNGFVIEHENVYYSMNELIGNKNDIEIKFHELKKGNTQCAEFRFQDEWIGECEIHFVSDDTVYLRWFYIDEKSRIKNWEAFVCSHWLQFWPDKDINA